LITYVITTVSRRANARAVTVASGDLLNKTEQNRQKQSAQKHFNRNKMQCKRNDMQQLEQPDRGRQRNWIDSGIKMHGALEVPFALRVNYGDGGILDCFSPIWI
jgi:hypothetical protein